ncbi:hypothetical protein Goshw_021940, partial [Gossypium schwendimanii]|nr:hypothetical protein [Gossypium schwendimanii]
FAAGLASEGLKPFCAIYSSFLQRGFDQWRPMILPDKYIDHGSQNDQIEEAGLSSKHIAATVLSTLGHTRGCVHLLDLID